MSAQNSDTLIANALSRLGNPTLTTDAQTWILNILDRFYEDFRWPFLEKLSVTTISASAKNIALPSDFDEPWDNDSFVLVDQTSGAYQYLQPIMQFDYDALSNPLTTASPPLYALIDGNAKTWTPYPLANKTYTLNLRYKYKPVRAGSYSNFTPAFPNDMLIEQAIFVTGLQHEDDERYGMELQQLQRMMGEYKAKFNKNPHKNLAARLSNKFKQIVVIRG
jgi:hypothetical protein